MDLNWPGLALGYVGYRGVRAVYNRMPGYKRKQRSNVPNKFGFRTKIRRKTTRQTPMYRQPSYAKMNDLDRKFVMLKDIYTEQLPGNTTVFGYFKLQDIQQMPAFQRFENLYSSFRIHKMTVKFFQGEYVHQAISMVSNTDQDAVTTQDFILRQPTCYIHNLSQNYRGAPPQRTMKLITPGCADSWKDFISTNAVTAQIGNATTEGTKKAAIKYAFTSQNAANGVQVEMVRLCLVEFMGLADTTLVD